MRSSGPRAARGQAVCAERRRVDFVIGPLKSRGETEICVVMNWKIALLATATAVAAPASRAESTLPVEDAREKLQAGALLVDVRTPAEFAAQKLSGAVNIPVDSVKTGITNHVSDKSKVVLLHCRTGRRSAIAEKQLRSQGYTNVFNIGSFEQAARVVGETGR